MNLAVVLALLGRALPLDSSAAAPSRPKLVVVITVEGWLRIPQYVQWISLGVVFVVFNLVAFVPDSRRR